MSWTAIGLAVLVLFVVLNWLIAVDARLRGTVKKANPFARLFDSLNVQVLKLVGVATEAATDHVAAAEVDIVVAEQNLEGFEEQLLNLREEVKLNKKRLPKAAAEVAKWEKIYLAAVEANDEEGQAEAGRRLKTADSTLHGLTGLISDNEKVLSNLEAQKNNLKDGLANAEVLKDRLAAQKTSAELRQKAIQSGASAAEGLTVLKDLEEEVARAEARADALEEVDAGSKSLEAKYGEVSNAHNDRLAALRAKVGK